MSEDDSQSLNPTPTRFVNLTGETIHFHDPHGGVVEIFPSGKARCDTRRTLEMTQTAMFVDGGDAFLVPIYSKIHAFPRRVPPPADATVYIVDTPVAASIPGRKDVVVMDDLVRKGGKVVGCRAFCLPR